MKNSLRRAAIIFCFTCALVTTCAHATVGQPGTLDTTWNGTGTILTPIGSGTDAATAMTLQPDGKVLLAGDCFNGTNYDFCALRYLPNGTLDTTWNGTGTVITPIGSGSNITSATTLQPDGRVLVAGYCWNGWDYDFCAARYLANGTLDTSWNGTGKVITPIGSGDDLAAALTLQPDGKVLLAGNCYNGTNYGFCVARFLPNGMLDTTWNGTGKVFTLVGIVIDLATAMTLQPDGKVLVAGNCAVGNHFALCVARYLANGTLDATWNGNGTVITPLGINNSANAVALQPDGRVLVAGYCDSGANYGFCAARYLPNGTLDTTWNGTGTVITPVSSDGNYAYAMTLQPDGRVLIAGGCRNGTNAVFCVARFLPNGMLDTTWNGTGKILTLVGGSDSVARAITLQPDGKVLVAGYCSNGTNDDFCVARYDGGPFGYQNCKPDIDGDGSFLANTDALINMRIALGITGPAVVNGITFAATATRNTWPLIRDYLVTQCGMSLVL